jgi:AcrR family transcriptional regulator
LKKPHKSARKPKGDGHLRRGEILAAAEKIFIAEGYSGATIRKIADAVGVSSTALYMHFRDKDQILLEISNDAIERLLELNTEIAAQPIDPVSRVRVMLEAYMKFALDNPNTYQLVFCSTGDHVSPEKSADVLALGDRCFEKFSEPVHQIAASRAACARARPRGRRGVVERLPRPGVAADHQALARLVRRRPADEGHAGRLAVRPGHGLIS